MSKVLLALLCAVALVMSGCSGAEVAEEEPTEAVEETPSELTKKALNDYSWPELTEISSRISAASNYDEAREVARSFGIVEEDGSLTTQTKQIVLNGTRALDVRVAGILHDDRAEGEGRAGLVFMTVGALEIRPMNDEDTVVGGWEASSLRAWLEHEGFAMLDPELQKAIVRVNKLTNNAGRDADLGDVTVTQDRLWVFSATEVCGDISWDSEEFRYKRGSQNIDELLNSEGNQYECFAQAGVVYNSDPQGFLSLADTTGASPWWYRSVLPFEFWGQGESGTNGYFFQVRMSGYPESLGNPTEPASVVVGFCV